MKHTDELRDIRYEGLEWIKSIGRTVQRDNYDLVYTAPLAPGDLKGSVLDNLEYRFNNEQPADYRHPSMSVSDIIAIKHDGKVSYHYCDSFGFEPVPGFLPDNPLKNTEMAVEDDYGMIDGIINNGPKEPTVPSWNSRPAVVSPFPSWIGGRRPPGGSRQEKVCCCTAEKPAKDRSKKKQHSKRARKGRFDMGNFTFEEMNLLCIYNTGSRTGLIEL